MEPGRLEILVEPFKENDPGPHVLAVLDVLTERCPIVDVGPFSTTVDAEIDDLIALAGDVLRAGFDAGATAIQVRLEHR